MYLRFALSRYGKGSDAVKPENEQRDRFYAAELDKLSLEQIKSRLANGAYSGKRLKYAEAYVEQKELARYRRFEIGGWGIAFAAGGLLSAFLFWLFK